MSIFPINAMRIQREGRDYGGQISYYTLLLMDYTRPPRLVKLKNKAKVVNVNVKKELYFQ